MVDLACTRGGGGGGGLRRGARGSVFCVAISGMIIMARVQGKRALMHAIRCPAHNHNGSNW
jgi:hypothetical protein